MAAGVNRSANEIAVLATKAAGGAGAPPAQAAQFGAAAVAHLAGGGAIALLDQALGDLPAGGAIIDIPLTLQTAAEAGGALRIAGHPLLAAYIDSLPCAAHLAGDVLHLDLATPAARRAVARVDLPDAAYDRWSALAARLLVPESEASRSGGAGAGLTDND